MIETEAQLDERLSAPSEADTAVMRRLAGDILVLGAGGKMGPSLVRRCRRAVESSGIPRRVISVSRGLTGARDGGASADTDSIGCDLMDREQVERLPDCDNVLYLAGRKFGSTGRSDLTWATNTVIPVRVARRFRRSRIVVFSTGKVYPFAGKDSSGSVESDEPDPCGEYAQSCLGRERIFEYFSREFVTPVLILRLNYAVDLRYGVLVDIARKVFEGRPVDLTVSRFNVIWQGDANSYALRSLEHCASPPRVMNVTGPEILSVREAAERFGRRFGRPAIFTGQDSGRALLSDASACYRAMGRPEVGCEELEEMVARWIEIGGRSLDKPTRFEVVDGKF